VTIIAQQANGTAVSILPTQVFVAPGSGGAAGGFNFNQFTPSALWTINHNLGLKPVVQVFSVGGVEILADVIHLSPNQTQVRFASPTAGYARLI